MKSILLLSFFWMASVSNALTEVKDLNNKEVLAKYQRTKSSMGPNSFIIQTDYRSPSEQMLVTEKGEFTDGRITKYEISQNQLKKSAKITFNSDVVIFELKDGDKTKSNTETRKGIVLAPLSLVPYIESEIQRLKNKETLEVRIAVWDRLETVGMELSMVTESPLAHENNTTIIRMKPSNFIISKLVKPLFFRFDDSSKVITMMRGRLPIKKQNGSNFDDLDGILQIPAFSNPQL